MAKGQKCWKVAKLQWQLIWTSDHKLKTGFWLLYSPCVSLTSFLLMLLLLLLVTKTYSSNYMAYVSETRIICPICYLHQKVCNIVPLLFEDNLKTQMLKRKTKHKSYFVDLPGVSLCVFPVLWDFCFILVFKYLSWKKGFKKGRERMEEEEEEGNPSPCNYSYSLPLPSWNEWNPSTTCLFGNAKLTLTVQRQFKLNVARIFRLQEKGW